MKPSLEQLRAEIDRLDEQILPLLNRRAALAMEIGAIKQANGSALYVPSRERDVIERMVARNQGPLSHRSICRIYAEIMRSSLDIELATRVYAAGAAEDQLRQAVRFVAGGHTEVHAGGDDEAIITRFGQDPESLLVVTGDWLEQHSGAVSSMKAEWRGVWRVPLDGQHVRYHLLVHPDHRAAGERPATVYVLVEQADFAGGVPPAWVREVPAVSVEYAVSPTESRWGILQFRLEMSAREVREGWADHFARHSRAMWIVS